MEVSSPLCFCELKVQPIYAGADTLPRSPEPRTLEPGPAVGCSTKLSLRSEHRANSNETLHGKGPRSEVGYLRARCSQRTLDSTLFVTKPLPSGYAHKQRIIFVAGSSATQRLQVAARTLLLIHHPGCTPWYITALMTHELQCLDNTAQAHASRIQAACRIHERERERD